MQSNLSVICLIATRQTVRLVSGSALLVVAVLAFSGCGSDTPDTDPVAIRVGEREVRISEVQAEFDSLKANGSPLTKDGERFMENYVERLAALERARALKLDQDIELKRQAENLLIGRLKQVEVEDQLAALEVTDEELQDYYQANISDYSTPAQVRVALLYLEASKHLSDEARNGIRSKMEEGRSRALDLPAETRGFGADAMVYSDEATSRFKGGDIGWLQDGAARYRWPEVVVETAFNLDAGAISEVLETDAGFYLIKQLDSRASQVRPLGARVASSLKTKLLRQKKTEFERALKAQWEAQSDVELIAAAIAEIDFTNRPQDSETTPEFSAVR
jgi:parvulin-like peptidyl-prolyl isomerase